MKVINTLIYIIGLQYISLAQTASIPKTTLPGKHGVGFFVSSEEASNFRAKLTPSANTKEIIITSVPADTKVLSSYVIDFDITGTFTFKKDASLQIPFNCEAFIEDKVTGKIFNLRYSSAYTFNVDRVVPERFVLHLLDKTEQDTAVTLR